MRLLWQRESKPPIEDVERRLAEIADRLERATLELQTTVRQVQGGWHGGAEAEPERSA